MRKPAILADPVDGDTDCTSIYCFLSNPDKFWGSIVQSPPVAAVLGAAHRLALSSSKETPYIVRGANVTVQRGRSQTWLARADRRLDCVDATDVNDRLLSILTDTKHRGHLEKRPGRSGLKERVANNFPD
jgi:hypothetical protein